MGGVSILWSDVVYLHLSTLAPDMHRSIISCPISEPPSLPPCTHLTHLVTGSDSLHQLSRIEELHVMNYSASLQELYTSGHDVLTVIQRQIVTNVVLLYDGLALWVIHA